MSDRDGNQEIHRMNVGDCGNPAAPMPTRLTNNAASDSLPDWQPTRAATLAALAAAGPEPDAERRLQELLAETGGQ